jgi:hypothetical protein
MVLFKYTEDKDMFHTTLSESLIHGMLVSTILKLEEACSFKYMNKLQGMFKGTCLCLVFHHHIY